MRQKDEKELFKKLSQGTISKDELNQLNNWMANKGSKGLSDLMDKDWSTFNKKESLQQSPKWMMNSSRKSKATLISMWAKSWVGAASILILVLVLIGLLVGRPGPAKPSIIFEENTDNRKQLVYLPDGTEVWLKRNSTIVYPRQFNATQRVVKLNGEAFFDVVPDLNRPFVVQSDYVNIEVLGTAFNFISGKGKKIPEVALVKGAVKVSYARDSINVKPIVLEPGEKASIDTISKAITTISFIDNEQYEDAPYGWKDDILIFQKADVYEVARILEEWYNIEFTNIQDSLPSAPLVHRIDTKKITKLSKVLDGVSRTMPYKFQWLGGNSYAIRPR